MNTENLLQLLKNPLGITPEQTKILKEIIDTYPYFQCAHALHLKGLKNQQSFTYNNALKTTAAHSTDRSLLFEYITSTDFTNNTSQEEPELKKANAILDPTLFEQKHTASDPKIIITKQTEEDTSPEKKLAIGKPLEFTKQETHSFSEWLQLAHIKPIDRSKTENSLPKKEIDKEGQTKNSRKKRIDIIDAFITNAPKLQAKPTATTPTGNIANERIIPPEELMTETLARVYIEQKNFKKAKAAYRILSLKYPEKSGFFADQIRAIKKLEAN